MTSLIIDCDPGVDDAVALLLAFAARELDLLGVTTVAGNVGAALTARNARLIRQIAGREDVPVHAGCDRPMVRVPVEAEAFHGPSGLGSLPIVEPAAPAADGHAVTFIVETVMARPPGSVSLAVLGPMTNLAMALRLEPRLAERLGPVGFMGGTRREGGNITASAEYNAHADPHAAHVCFTAGLDITVMGLDATLQVRSTEARIARIAAAGTPSAQAAAHLLAWSRANEQAVVGWPAPPLHDPCVIAWLLRPSLFRLQPCRLDVETSSPLTLGHTAVEFRLRGGLAANAKWAVEVDANGLFDLLAETLA